MNLTKPQQLIYEMDRFSGGAISVVCGSMMIRGSKEIAELTKAANDIFRLNEALRIRINETNGVPQQYITEYEEKEIEVLQFETKEELDVYAEQYAKKPIDIFGELCLLKVIILKDSYGILVKTHHIISDAWTLTLIASQFNCLLDGVRPEVYSYSDYLSSEEIYLKSKRYEKDRAFFLEQFKKCDEVTYFLEKQAKENNSDRCSFVIDSDMASKIMEYIQRKNISPFILFVAAVAICFNRIKSNKEKFYIGTAVLNRVNRKEKNTMGMYINTVPILIELANEQSFVHNLDSVITSVMSVLRHQKCNYGEILKELRKKFDFGDKLYDVMISYQNAKITGCEQLESTWYHCGAQNESLQIHIDDHDNEGVFHIRYDYQTEKFTKQEIEMLHEHLLIILTDAIEDEDKKLFELEILTAEEKQKLMYEFNDTEIDYPKEKCVHQLFEEQVEKNPDKIAVIACDKTLTYVELNTEANRIAHGLIEKGVQVGDIVAFALERKSYLIATMLGILKAGAAYLPIDPDYPQDRIEFMLEDSGAKLFITNKNLKEIISGQKANNLELDICSDALCYILFTSGTTGKPKATQIRHNNLINFANNNNNNNYQSKLIRISSVVLAVTTVTFDISVFEIYVTLLNGLSLVLANEQDIESPARIGRLISKYKVDGFHSTPSKISLYMQEEEYCNAMKYLKIVMVGAEVFQEELLKNITRYSDTIVYNGYGPTETTIGVSFSCIQENNCLNSDITIGKPIANTQIYIVDQYMNPVPIGVTGELCIAGDGVGAGYLNRPELTAEKFIENPYGKGKLYKTGDLAYWREDGNIVYVGRNDFQVKIRGLRIELGEIESAISAVDGVTQVVVVVRKNEEGRQYICAFYAGKEVEAKELRRVIGQKLPKYMIPHIFTHMEVIPLTTSGKVNRNALPQVSLEKVISNVEYVPPKTRQQKVLCQIIEKVLGVSPIGLRNDFFEMGGDSLKAIEYVAKAHNEGIYFSAQNVFDYPNVESLMNYMEQYDKNMVHYDEVEFVKINEILEKNKIDISCIPQKTKVGNILLAGATGYLGIHILADFLEKDEGNVFCLIRGKNSEDSTKRLQQLLDFYFGKQYSDMKRIKVICADLQKDKFGLSDSEYEALTEEINTVINAAASVKHYGSYQYFYEANVESTKRLIQFCKDADAKLIHTSTLSVSGNSFGDDFDAYISEAGLHFTESNLYINQPLENVYARSKFEAEKAVLEAMTEGLQANIMRMGNLTNRSDGKFQKNYESNAFLKRMRAFWELGIFPAYLKSMYIEFTPIDSAANAVMTIVRHFNKEQTVFHISNSKVITLYNLMELFQKTGLEVKVVDRQTFTTALRKTVENKEKQNVFETFINDMDENDQLNYDSNIRIDNNFTVEYLQRLGFEWLEIDYEYIYRYVKWFQKIGYFK